MRSLVLSYVHTYIHIHINTAVTHHDDEAGWGGGDDGWDEEFGSEFDGQTSYPTLTAYDNSGVKILFDFEKPDANSRLGLCVCVCMCVCLHVCMYDYYGGFCLILKNWMQIAGRACMCVCVYVCTTIQGSNFCLILRIRMQMAGWARVCMHVCMYGYYGVKILFDFKKSDANSRLDFVYVCMYV